MKIGYKRTDINTGFAVTVITIKLDAGYAQKVSILGTWVNHLKGIKHRQLEKSQTGSSVSNPTVKLLCFQ